MELGPAVALRHSVSAYTRFALEAKKIMRVAVFFHVKGVLGAFQHRVKCHSAQFVSRANVQLSFEVFAMGINGVRA